MLPFKETVTQLISLACATAFLFAAIPASAQTNDEINAVIQFNFSNPGARSLGLGGAFIGLADDATAAYANPAGLNILSKPEISIEGRQWDYTHVFTESGDLRNGRDSLVRGEATDDVSGLSFLSYVYPGKRWAVAVYRHDLANFEANFDEAFGAGIILSDTSRLFPVKTSLEMEIVNTGISLAFELSERFSVGLGVSSLDFELNSRTQRFDIEMPDVLVNQQIQSGDDDQITWNLGFLWEIKEDRFSIGGVFRQGADFEMVAENQNPDGVPFRDPATPRFNLPDVLGVGIALKPADRFTITLDVVMIKYSQLTDDFKNLFDENPDFDVEHFSVDDGEEIRLGFEYVLLPGGQPLPIRFGIWSDPDHSILYSGADLADQALFLGGDDEIHYSFGVGRSFGQKFQIDAAVDISDRVDTTSVSAIFRF